MRKIVDFFCLSLTLLTIQCLQPCWSQTVTPDNVFEYCQQIVQEIQQAYPNSPESYAAMGYVYHRAKKYEDAIQSFQKSLDLNPKQPMIVQMMAFIYNQLTQYEQAVVWYKKALELEPDAPRANKRLGLALQQLNRMDEATKAFEDELHNFPTDASAHVYLGERYLDSNRLEEAEEQANLAKQYDPRLPEPYYLLGKIFRKQKQLDKAKEMLEIFQKKKDEEQAYIEETVQDTTDQENAQNAAVQTHIDAGTIYFSLNQMDKAEYHFLRVTGIDPKNIEARYNLTLIYQQQNQLDKAAKVFQELLAIDANDPRFLIGLGLIRFGQKNYAEARAYIEKVLAQDPNNLSGQRIMARILLSTNQEPDRALRYLENVTKGDPEAMDYDLLGWAYFINGQPQKSLEALRTAMTMDPNNPTYRRRYDQLMAKLKQE